MSVWLMIVCFHFKTHLRDRTSIIDKMSKKCFVRPKQFMVSANVSYIKRVKQLYTNLEPKNATLSNEELVTTVQSELSCFELLTVAIGAVGMTKKSQKSLFKADLFRKNKRLGSISAQST